MDILNIANVDYEEVIKKVVREVNEEYKDLTKVQTCIKFSDLIHHKLKQRHVIASIINTKQLGFDYEHRFNLVNNKDKYYLIDLTYNQFFESVPEDFDELGKKGYQKGDKQMVTKYLESIFDKDIITKRKK